MKFLIFALLFVIALSCGDRVDTTEEGEFEAWNLEEPSPNTSVPPLPEPGECPDPEDDHVTFVGFDRDSCNEARFGQTGSASCEPGQTKFDEECGCGCIGQAHQLCDIDGCPARQYCHYEDGECGATGERGLCKPIPTDCTDDVAEICGCDGRSYSGSSRCAAPEAGVDTNPDVTTCGLLPECYLPSSGGVQSGQCLIDNQCHAEGTVNPDDDCQRCKPERSPNRWTEIRGCRPQVSAGRYHSCATDADNQPHCWPSDGDSGGRASPPDNAFLQLSPGHFHSCGIDTAHQLQCWGSDHEELSESPTGDFWQVSASRWYSCAVDDDYELTCWGRTDLSNQQHDPPPGQFVQVSTATEYGCAVEFGPGLDFGQIRCWGGPPGSPPPGNFEAVSAGPNDACALDAQGEIECWGNSPQIQEAVPDASFIDVSVGGSHACAIDTSHHLHCWGSDGQNQASPPDGQYAQVSAGRYHTCAVDTSNHILCWGDPDRI